MGLVPNGFFCPAIGLCGRCPAQTGCAALVAYKGEQHCTSVELGTAVFDNVPWPAAPQVKAERLGIHDRATSVIASPVTGDT